MSIRALQDYTLVSKYSRYDASKKRRETWNEAVIRMRDMHLRRYPNVADDINWAFEQVRAKRVLGSQRALQFGGKPIESKHSRQYNCTAAYCDRMRFFQEAFWLLLCGSGVGFSVQTHHVVKLPNFHWSVQASAVLQSETLGKTVNVEAFELPKGPRTFVIPDTIEGWADALGVLLASFLPHPELEDWAAYEVIFDYSEIRPKGSPLASGVGKAPGPEPLWRSLEVIRRLLKERVCASQERLRSIDAYDIVMHASDAVLSGGVRRSATICLFSPDDQDMLQAKLDYTDENGVFHSWFQENPQRARSNNSVMLLRDKTTKEDFARIMGFVKQYGEPGFVWTDSLELIVNPCVEVGMYPVDEETGFSGWQACNLCEINGSKLKTKEDFQLAAKAAAMIGTWQAGYTDFPYLGAVTERIVRREALLGVSMTGMMDNPHIAFDPELQREMAALVVKTNQEMAARIGIRPAARCTCIKPSGNSSALLGTGSGIHPHHSKRYIRHVQANALEAPFLHFQKTNPAACEKSVWNPNGTDYVIAFLVTPPAKAKTKKDLDAVSLLEHVKSTQQNWVASGKVADLCTAPWLSHNVSNTINVGPDEWGAVTDFIYENRTYFAGIALLSTSGDKDYPQAPMTSVLTKDEILGQYKIDEGTYNEVERLVNRGQLLFDGDLWKACDAILNYSSKKDVLTQGQTFWIAEVVGFYLRTDLPPEMATYLLKDVYNCEKWNRLSADYKDVDYTTMIEDKDETTLLQEVACAGGACLVA